ncbi:hypothetical protein PG997_009843 [Apiospora hydei]|uniref:Trihydrophobin n=1 Tax=Apiospora hydei TaxID=1337664 RepID=A0ABR1VVA1_9PEZI
MKLLSIVPSLLLATLASACVQEGRACAAGGEKCCLRRSCVSNTQGSSLGFCVSLDADSLLQQPMPTPVPAAAPPAMGGAGGAAGQPNNGGMGGGMPNGNNGNGQMPAPADMNNGGQPANPNNGQQGNNGPGMFPVGGGQPMSANAPGKVNTGSAPPFYIVPTEN